MAKMGDVVIEAALRELPDWSRDAGYLVRVVKRKDWLAAIALVDVVAAEADRRDHHPDLCVTGYRTVTFRLTSHDAGGITKRDFDMARAIDELAGADQPRGASPPVRTLPPPPAGSYGHRHPSREDDES